MYPEEGRQCQLPAWQEAPWDGLRLTSQLSLSLSFPQKQPQKIFVGTAKASVPTRLTQRGCQEPTDLSAPGTCEPELLRMLACPPPPPRPG